jgi:hypothetical protein
MTTELGAYPRQGAISAKQLRSFAFRWHAADMVKVGTGEPALVSVPARHAGFEVKGVC